MSHFNNNSQETNTDVTYVKGCNGDCYQGRWCDCKDGPLEFSEQDKNELVSTVLISLIIAVICTAVVAFIANGTIVYGG
jgi:hypothetical protein